MNAKRGTAKMQFLFVFVSFISFLFIFCKHWHQQWGACALMAAVFVEAEAC